MGKDLIIRFSYRKSFLIFSVSPVRLHSSGTSHILGKTNYTTYIPHTFLKKDENLYYLLPHGLLCLCLDPWL